MLLNCLIFSGIYPIFRRLIHIAGYCDADYLYRSLSFLLMLLIIMRFSVVARLIIVACVNDNII